MTYFVPRTCTVIREGEDAHRNRSETSVPLKRFRDKPSYVLLSDPGAGKTTAFREECEALGKEAIMVSARDFLSLDVDNRPEWRKKTLFIDGLDEVRAGSSDARTPMNLLYGRLDHLRPPRFRISCREADWLGENDRGRLATVSPSSKVLTLRLDPLTSDDIKRVLNANAGVDDTEAFISEAQLRGLGGLLSNPQTLNMLAEVVGRGAAWPESRLDTFELACRRMATEHNEEHAIGKPPAAVEDLLDAAGRLCAVQLIAGVAGYTIRHHSVNGGYLPVEALEYKSVSLLKAALSTMLFTAEGDGCFTPAHRHIAEFLGARHLAKLIDSGLPAKRVVALIAQNGYVVTEMRGLSAWLAAHSAKARYELIEGDPIGVGLYGDIQSFSGEDKNLLLRSLNREVGGTGYARESLAAFAPLVTADMESTLHDLLKDDRRDYDHQLVVEFILLIMAHGEPLPRLHKVLLEVLRDDSRWPRVVNAALDASIRWTENGSDRKEEHRKLLEDIYTGRFQDPDSELSGRLLIHLYPHEVPPSQVWDYLSSGPRPGLIGMCFLFWDRCLFEQSSDGDVAVLLDQLCERMPGLALRLDSHSLLDVPIRLLARGLRTHGDEVSGERLYNWLSGCSVENTGAYNRIGQSLLEVREWLEQRPHIQKAAMQEGLLQIPDTDGFPYSAGRVRDCLHGSDLPDDFGLWCMKRAVELEESHLPVAKYLLAFAVYCHRRRTSNAGLSQSVLEERTQGHPKLEKELETLLKRPDVNPSEESGRKIRKYEEEDRRRRQEWIEHVRSNADALRENQGSPIILHEIARAYFGVQKVHESGDSPDQRLKDLLGNESELVEAATTGLRRTMWREDLPTADEVIRLNAESRTPYLSLAALAGMDVIERQDPSRLNRMNDDQVRAALTFYYCGPNIQREEPGWYRRCLGSAPHLVEDVLVSCATSAIRAGKEHVPGLSHIAKDESDHDRVAGNASLKLLRMFPVRCKANQLGALDDLLWIAVRHADAPSLDRLIERKVSLKSMTVSQRVHWLTAGVVISPDKYGRLLEDFTAGKEARIRELAAFFSPQQAMPDPISALDANSLEPFIGLMGSLFGPATPDGWITPAIKASEIIDRMIGLLEAPRGENSLRSLELLRSNVALEPWRFRLDRAIDRRRIVERDAAFRHPTVEQACLTLADGVPSNAADLAALLVDNLKDISLRVRTGNTNDWRQYWNEDPHRRPSEPRHEDSCRDTILSDLRTALPADVDAQPEGRYASDKRSDIRAAYGNFNVPVEAKKNSHRDLWSAVHNQLIEKYTSDPATEGYGIYLVFWFGEEVTQPPPHGSRPKTADELQARLKATLSAEESRKISICVIDVCPPGVMSLLGLKR